jgi:hypothetical protein
MVFSVPLSQFKAKRQSSPNTVRLSTNKGVRADISQRADYTRLTAQRQISPSLKREITMAFFLSTI